MKESGVVDRLTKTAQNELMNIITIFLGVSVGATATADRFLGIGAGDNILLPSTWWKMLNSNTIRIIILGLLAFCFGTACGVLLGKVMCWATKGKINPLIGSAGVSAVPMEV